MKEIYIMLTQVGTIISKSIKLYTKAKYNHISIGMDPGVRVFYSFARRTRFFPFIAGFIRERLHEGMFSYHRDTECVIYALPVDEDQYARVSSLIEGYTCDKIKYKYNFLALLGIPMNRPIHMRNRYTCAEFVASVLHEAGIHTITKPFSLARPDDITEIPGLAVIYEGKMHEFRPTEYFPDPA